MAGAAPGQLGHSTGGLEPQTPNSFPKTPPQLLSSLWDLCCCPQTLGTGDKAQGGPSQGILVPRTPWWSWGQPDAEGKWGPGQEMRTPGSYSWGRD